MAENTETFYTAYVSQQNLLVDESDVPVTHPLLEEMFEGIKNGKYIGFVSKSKLFSSYRRLLLEVTED